MLKVIEKDILTVEQGIICHQVNCRGVMGSGIARAIKDKWPIVYSRYAHRCMVKDKSELLGAICVVSLYDKLHVANIFGQYNFGRSGLQYTDYHAVDISFNNLKRWLQENKNNEQVYVPYKMGCGLANGKWETYEPIIEKWFPDAVVCKLGE